jgi:hypothetical protein
MRKVFLSTVAAASLVALPALAATDVTNNQSSNNSPPSAAQIQQNLHQELSKAGYTDIQIIPGSFLVRAKDSKGNPTEMMVTPNSLTAVTAMSSSSGSSQNGTSNSTTSK